MFNVDYYPTQSTSHVTEQNILNSFLCIYSSDIIHRAITLNSIMSHLRLLEMSESPQISAVLDDFEELSGHSNKPIINTNHFKSLSTSWYMLPPSAIVIVKYTIQHYKKRNSYSRGHINRDYSINHSMLCEGRTK